jgi:hypothetical protein
MSIFDNIGRLFHHNVNDGKLPPGNSQWSQLANFFPEDSNAGKSFKGDHRLNLSDALTALGALAANQAAPPPPPQPQWMAPPPPPQFPDLLSAAPRLPQRSMPTPSWMQPYMWGGR